MAEVSGDEAGGFRTTTCFAAGFGLVSMSLEAEMDGRWKASYTLLIPKGTTLPK